MHGLGDVMLFGFHNGAPLLVLVNIVALLFATGLALLALIWVIIGALKFGSLMLRGLYALLGRSTPRV